jgi:hypothetical protein
VIVVVSYLILITNGQQVAVKEVTVLHRLVAALGHAHPKPEQPQQSGPSEFWCKKVRCYFLLLNIKIKRIRTT